MKQFSIQAFCGSIQSGTEFTNPEETVYTMEKKLVKQKENKLQEQLQAVGGLLLTGAGLSMTVDAGSVKSKGGKWFWYGTLALVVFQAGLCLVVDSVRHSSRE